MTRSSLPTVSQAQMRALADFRFTLRKFLHFSEEAAQHAELKPQHHQLMLQIAGAPEGSRITVGYLAERLVLRHHSVVELGDRCEEAGLIVRRRDPQDRRQVLLELTAAGHRVLSELTADHSRELTELGPQLIQALKGCIARRPANRTGKPRPHAGDRSMKTIGA